MSSKQHFDGIYSTYRNDMLKTIHETMRTLKPGGKFVIWPEPRYLVQEARADIAAPGIEIETEDTGGDLTRILKGTEWNEFCNRLVLRKI